MKNISALVSGLGAWGILMVFVPTLRVDELGVNFRSTVIEAV